MESWEILVEPETTKQVCPSIEILGLDCGHINSFKVSSSRDLVSCKIDVNSVLVFATDVWLHVVTTTISVPMASAIAGAQADYSLSLKSDCSVTNNSYVALYRANTTCNVGPVGRIIELDDPGLHYETLNNQSTKLSIVQYEANQSISYLSVSPAAVDPSYDFKATTIGIQMNCKTISDDCDLSFTGSSAYNCSNGAFAETNSNFNRDGGFNMQSFKYPNMSDTADPYRAYGIHNPFYWTAALRTPSSLYGTANLSNSGFIYNLGVVSTVLLCEVTVLDVEYESVQGQVTHLSTSMASDSTANIFNLVPASQVLGEFGWTNVQTAVQLAAILTKDTEDFISRFAKSLSNTLLSSGVGAVQQAPSLVAQQRINTLVTKMPKTPFYTFLGITCAFIFMGGVLTGLALWSTEEARAVKMRLSASGLVAAMFEGGGSRKQVQRVEEMFAEYAGSTEEVKIGFDRTDEGGFQFRAHRSNKEDEIVVMWEQTQHQRIEQPKNDHQSEFPHSGTFHGYLIQ